MLIKHARAATGRFAERSYGAVRAKRGYGVVRWEGSYMDGLGEGSYGAAR